MKKRKTAVLLAAVLCLELWIGAAPENARQKNLLLASAEELSDQTEMKETADASIIVESEILPEPETEFKPEQNPEQKTETELSSESASDELADGAVILKVEEVPEPESMEGESELSETELEPEEVTSHSGRAEDGDGMLRAAARAVYSGSYGNQLSGQAAQI